MKDSSFFLAVIDAESTGFFEPRRREKKQQCEGNKETNKISKQVKK
jgi:hypothetical protein